jgi:fibro-slime domain-containing protein
MRGRFLFTAGSTFTVLLGTAYLALWSKHPAPSAAGSAGPPAALQLTGVVRDFKEWTVPGGQSDMERTPDNGFGRYSGNVELTLSDDNKPVFMGDGHKVSSQWRDSDHRQICHCLYDPALDDQEGSWGDQSTGGIQSPASFNQWYHDVPGLNLSAPLTLTLIRQSDGSYVFDDKYDPLYSDLGGFFPIDGLLFGNSPGSPNHNYHFTFELHTEFTYEAAAEQVFKFIGDDDVWVFIDGKLVIDLGGVHAAHDQFVELNRLGLQDGQSYKLDFFFAERHRTQSNFRIQTNIRLSTASIPSVMSAYD